MLSCQLISLLWRASRIGATNSFAPPNWIGLSCAILAFLGWILISAVRFILLMIAATSKVLHHVIRFSIMYPLYQLAWHVTCYNAAVEQYGLESNEAIFEYRSMLIITPMYLLATFVINQVYCSYAFVQRNEPLRHRCCSVHAGQGMIEDRGISSDLEAGSYTNGQTIGGQVSPSGAAVEYGVACASSALREPERTLDAASQCDPKRVPSFRSDVSFENNMNLANLVWWDTLVPRCALYCIERSDKLIDLAVNKIAGFDQTREQVEELASALRGLLDGDRHVLRRGKPDSGPCDMTLGVQKVTQPVDQPQHPEMGVSSTTVIIME